MDFITYNRHRHTERQIETHTNTHTDTEPQQLFGIRLATLNRIGQPTV